MILNKVHESTFSSFKFLTEKKADKIRQNNQTAST